MWVEGGEEVHKKLISMERHLKCLENVSIHNYMLLYTYIYMLRPDCKPGPLKAGWSDYKPL